jgi:hypothetical protein
LEVFFFVAEEVGTFVGASVDVGASVASVSSTGSSTALHAARVITAVSNIAAHKMNERIFLVNIIAPLIFGIA